jgi:transcription antitermination protein NusB
VGRSSTRARAWALQALYACEMRGAPPEEALHVLDELADDMRVPRSNRLVAEVLVRIVGRELPQIDRLIQRHLSDWRLERLSALDRNILRLGAAELLFVDDVPARTTVREMVQLAEKYGTPESPRFVNGVLDGLLRGMAPAERTEGA